MDKLLFELFWENSKLNDVTLPLFAKRIEQDARMAHEDPALLFSKRAITFKKGKSQNIALLEQRKSVRSFKPHALTDKELSVLCLPFSSQSDGRRLLASAGGKYPVEVFIWLCGAEGTDTGKVLYYEADTHAYVEVAEISSNQDFYNLTGVEVRGRPSALFLFCLRSERTTSKYGERGGRFALIEVGQYTHALVMQALELQLGTCYAGGVLDDPIKQLYKIPQSLKIAAGVFVGKPQESK